MKKSPLKQLGPTILDNAGAYHKIKKGIPRALGAIASMLPIGRGVSFLRAPVTNFWKGGTVNFGNIGSKINRSTQELIKKRKGLETKLTNLKNPNTMGPTKETINYLKNYSKDFGPIIKNMKK